MDYFHHFLRTIPGVLVSNETISNKTTEETEGVVGMRIDLHFPAAQIRVLRGQNWVHHLISFYGKESLYHKEILLKFPFLRVQRFRSYGESLERRWCVVEDTSSPPVFAQGGASLQTYRTDVYENVAQTYERLGGSLHIIQYYDKNSLYTIWISICL